VTRANEHGLIGAFLDQCASGQRLLRIQTSTMNDRLNLVEALIAVGEEVQEAELLSLPTKSSMIRCSCRNEGARFGQGPQTRPGEPELVTVAGREPLCEGSSWQLVQQKAKAFQMG